MDPREQADRIAACPLLAQAESLCRLLRFLAQQAVEHPGVALREAQIAQEVFGRGEGFDPRADSTVRVQTSRLRGRLAEYYRTLGAEDEVVLELPRGQYHLVVRGRNGQVEAVQGEAEAAAGKAAAEVPVAVETVVKPERTPSPPAPAKRAEPAPRVWPRVAAAALAGFLAGALAMHWLGPRCAGLP